MSGLGMLGLSKFCYQHSAIVVFLLVVLSFGFGLVIGILI